jgi:hypothetical protein
VAPRWVSQCPEGDPYPPIQRFDILRPHYVVGGYGRGGRGVFSNWKSLGPDTPGREESELFSFSTVSTLYDGNYFVVRWRLRNGNQFDVLAPCRRFAVSFGPSSGKQKVGGNSDSRLATVNLAIDIVPSPDFCLSVSSCERAFLARRYYVLHSVLQAAGTAYCGYCFSPRNTAVNPPPLFGSNAVSDMVVFVSVTDGYSRVSVSLKKPARRLRTVTLKAVPDKC